MRSEYVFRNAINLCLAENVRDIPNGVDIPMTVGHYLRSMAQLTNQFTPTSYRDPKRQRLYLKDIDCPEEWARDLQELIPEPFFYLNDCIEFRTGGDGAIPEANEYGQMKYGRGVAPAGDLMSSLPAEMRALNMMCYIGHEGTYTPAHREMCASLGHNVMVEASNDGNGEKAGSSIWFMTETKEREVVSEYFLSMLGHDIEVEKHFAQVNAWKKAPFNVLVIEQKPGDLILIPPLAPHQVWNRGTRTMKAAWNRTTVDTLELALHEALPRARLVCREEQYKNKAIIYFTLIKYHELLQRDTIEPKMWKYGRIKQLLEDLRRLFALYTEILVSEMFASILPSEQDVEFLPYDSNVTCSYCRCNIFNRFLTCKTCIETGPNGEEDTYDICMECYAMGRSCGCMSNLKWVEQWEWLVLTRNYEDWRNVIVQCDGYFDVQKSPQPLDVARKRYGRKPVAHICQEQLKIRPWHDISKPFVPDPSPGASDVEPEVDDSGRPKKKTPRKSRNGKVQPAKNKTYACHVCCHHDWNWRLAFCTTCNNAYCYGVLWRAFDLMPQVVMEDRDWSCPKCQGICSCGKCRKNPSQKPYAPQGTLLGHDTKKVADIRSIESLVDFSKTNLTWLRGENDHDPQQSARMKRLKEKAEEAKAREDVIDEKYLDNNVEHLASEAGEDTLFEHDGHIDPLLRDLTTSFPSQGNDEIHYQSPYMSITSAVDGDDNLSFKAPEAVMWQALSENHLNDDFDVSNRSEISYPAGLLGSAAPLQAPEQPFPEQDHHGQSRMMGIGFYKQDNGVDKILYDPPDLEGTANESQSIHRSTAANFALSDLLQPQPQSKGAKKRRHDAGSGGEDDTDFFTSNSQKKLAKAKRPKDMHDETLPGQTAYRPTSSHRPPRQSVGKPQTYLDLGEDAEPVLDSETTVVKARNPKVKHDGNSDADGIKQATRRLTSTRSTENLSRRRTRGKQTGDTASRVTIATPTSRKSAWLARREAQDTRTKLPATPPRKRGRPKTKHDTSLSLDVLSGDYEDDIDGIFGDHDGEKADANASTKRSMSQKQSSNVASRGRRVSLDSHAEQAEKPKPRPRGRPRKGDTTPIKPFGPIQLPSLKEKLALNGKSAKIVSSRTSALPGSSVDTPRAPSPLTTAKKPQAKTAAAGYSTNGAVHLAESELNMTSEDATIPPIVKPSNLPNGHAKVAAAPRAKGPTVVRLSSLSTQSDELDQLGYAGSTDCSSDDSSIPAVKPARKGAGIHT
jgi:hypothetical protein